LPAPCFNQYNISVLRSAIHSARSDFGRIIARKFERGRFLIIGGVESEKLERHFGELGREADVLQRDPYYNINLSRERADFSLGK
jgi:hypothetical protein